MKPQRRVEPGPGQESVWDYPRPPRVEETNKHIQVVLNGVVIADTHRAKRVLETSHPPVYYIPPEDVKMEYFTPTSHATFCLPSPAVVLPGKVAFCGKGGLLATRQAAHVYMQQLKAGLVVVPKGLTVLSIDFIQRLLQLDHVLGCASIQRFLNDRLLGTGFPSEGSLQADISSQARIDFHQLWAPANKLIKASESFSIGVCLTVFCRICTWVRIGPNRSS